MEKDINTIKNTLLVFLGIVFAYLIKELSNLLIPLALSFFLALLLYPILKWFQQRRVPFPISLSLIFMVGFYAINRVGELIFQTFAQIINDQERLLAQIQLRIEPWLHFAETRLRIDLDDYSGSFWELVNQYLSLNQLLLSSGTFAGFVKSVGTMLFMTSLYSIVILGGILHYERYLNYVSGSEGGKLTQAFEQIKSSITTYIKVKFLISLSTGISFWLTCHFFGVDFALFWGFLAFLLNFIPTFGSIIATIPPILMGWIQIPSLGTLLVLALMLIGLQILLGNILDPMLMGNSLSINTVVVLLGLVTWTYLWGIVGTILAVPLLVLVKVVLQQVPDAQMLVRLMGGPPRQSVLSADLPDEYADP